MQQKEETKKFLESCLGVNFSIAGIEKKPGKRNPAPPFTTSTLQQAASTRLGFSVKQTMMVAQRLYEAGKITYMRTDSLNLSDLAVSDAVKNITSKYGKQFVETRKFKTKSKNAQEAHEAVRPTDFSVEVAGLDEQQKKLYSLIWKRAIASQMAPARLERTTMKIGNEEVEYDFIAKGEIVTFEGFLKAYGTDDTDKLLPAVTEGDEVKVEYLYSRQIFSKPPARYTEASLVKILEEKGIGRPSTFAPTISTIQDRGYVIKGIDEGTEREYIQFGLKIGKIVESTRTEKTGANKGKLVPTSIGIVVNNFLVKHFSQIVDYDFTKNVEEEFDEIAEGTKKWNAMISDFYGDFHKNMEFKMETVERSEAINERVLGEDPKTGKPLSVRVGRYGAYAQIGTKDDDEKPTFASLKPNQHMDTITFEEAIELFKLPRIVGQTDEGHDIKSNYGRFGPFIMFKDDTAGKILYQSLKDLDPMDVTLEQALDLVAYKKKVEIEKYIKNFRDDPKAKTDADKSIEILKGRWGPYVTDGDKNIRVPKDIEDATTLTLKDCKELLKKAKPGKKKVKKKTKKKVVKKKTTKKKTVKKTTSKKVVKKKTVKKK